jgi:hypothetical protein
MASFTLKSGVSAAFFTGVGRVVAGQILTGEEFRRFVPAILVETATAEVVAAPVASVITEVRPAAPVQAAPPVPAVVPEASVETITEVQPPVAGSVLTEVSAADSDAKMGKKPKRR